MSSGLLITYVLRPPNGELANGALELMPAAIVDTLARAVLRDNAQLLPNYPLNRLRVYAPGTPVPETKQALDPEETLANHIPGPAVTDRAQRRFIVIAPLLDLRPGIQGDQPQPFLRSSSC